MTCTKLSDQFLETEQGLSPVFKQLLIYLPNKFKDKKYICTRNGILWYEDQNGLPAQSAHKPFFIEKPAGFWQENYS